MLNRDNVFAVSHQAYRLWRLPKGAIGRTLRRFLREIAEGGMLLQSFAYEQGYSPVQLAALEAYARRCDDALQEYLPQGVVVRGGTYRDEPYGIVATHYRFIHDIATASVAQLRDMVKVVAVLAESMQDFAISVNVALADCPTYVYRGLPCSIAPDEQLWTVGGQDRMDNSGGVLEWCYDMQDAMAVLEAMARHPGRFTNLGAQPFLPAQNMPAIFTASVFA
jgi:hypothetical protein